MDVSRMSTASEGARAGRSMAVRASASLSSAHCWLATSAHDEMSPHLQRSHVPVMMVSWLAAVRHALSHDSDCTTSRMIEPQSVFHGVYIKGTLLAAAAEPASAFVYVSLRLHQSTLLAAAAASTLLPRRLPGVRKRLSLGEDSLLRRRLRLQRVDRHGAPRDGIPRHEREQRCEARVWAAILCGA